MGYVAHKLLSLGHAAALAAVPALSGYIVLAYAGLALLMSRVVAHSSLRSVAAPQGIDSFELAGTGQRAADMVQSWDSYQRRAAVRGIVWDFPMAVFYGALLWMLVSGGCRPTRGSLMLSMLAPATLKHPGMPDVVWQFARLFGSSPVKDGDVRAPIATACAAVKFSLVAVVSLVLLGGVGDFAWEWLKGTAWGGPGRGGLCGVVGAGERVGDCPEDTLQCPGGHSSWHTRAHCCLPGHGGRGLPRVSIACCVANFCEQLTLWEANMPDRITFHWSAGRYTANDIDKSDYHYLVEYDKKNKTAVVRKQHPTDRTLPHTYRRNSNNIAVSICGMFGASPTNFGPEPITGLQVEAACFVASQIALLKGISVSAIKTHAEYAIEDGYFLDNSAGVDRFGDPVNGDVRWDLILQPSTKSADQLAKIAKQDAAKLRERVESYLAENSHRDIARRTLVKMGPIYKVSSTGVSARQSDDSFTKLGSLIGPSVLN